MFQFYTVTVLSVFLKFFMVAFKLGDGQTLRLEGEWQLSNKNGSFGLKAPVPGYVHTALLKAGYIDDPLYRYNDELYRWIDYDNWTYSKSFDG